MFSKQQEKKNKIETNFKFKFSSPSMRCRQYPVHILILPLGTFSNFHERAQKNELLLKHKMILN